VFVHGGVDCSFDRIRTVSKSPSDDRPTVIDEAIIMAQGSIDTGDSWFASVQSSHLSSLDKSGSLEKISTSNGGMICEGNGDNTLQAEFYIGPNKYVSIQYSK